MVSIESMLTRIDNGFIKIHSVFSKFIEASEGGEKGGDFVELDNGGF